MKHRIRFGMKNRLFLVFAVMAFALQPGMLQAQELKVTPLKVLTGDMTASYDTAHFDNRRIPCALIKVSAPHLEGIKFISDRIKEQKYDSGVYYVWVAADTKKLKYRHPDYLVGEMEFESPVESKVTYMIVIQAPDTQSDTEALQRELETLKQEYRDLREAIEGIAEAKAEAKAQALAEEEARAKAEAKAQAIAESKARSAENGLLENGHEAVDLGLPSGLLWATCNVGASSPGDYGNYYAWGETTTKSNYKWSTLKYCKDSSGDSFSKYVTDSSYGTVDNKTTLEASDDAATANWGGSWRTPTTKEWQELNNNCTWTWTTQDGHDGYKVTSKKNGNSLFLPAAGYRYSTTIYREGTYGYYWSSSLNEGESTHKSALDCYFDSDSPKAYYQNRYYGLSVRPVME